MSEGTLAERLTYGAVNTVLTWTRDMPDERRVHDQWPMEVVAVRDLAPQVRRISLGAPQFAEWEPMGADEYFGLLMPRPGHPLSMPPPGRLNIRASVQTMAEEDRPDLRWYTVRRHRPHRATIDVDIVTHGDAGPGSAWALRARAGDRVGFRTGTACHRFRPDNESQLLVADETALPAVAAIGDAARGRGHGGRITAIVETPGGHVETPLDHCPFPVQRIRRRHHPGLALLAALQAFDVDTLDHAWVCGEAGMAAGVRRHLIRERGMSRTAIMFSGYWKLGAPRG